MEAAEPWHGNDLRCFLCSFRRRPACRGFLVQPEVRPVVMIVAKVDVYTLFSPPSGRMTGYSDVTFPLLPGWRPTRRNEVFGASEGNSNSKDA